jgi:hypothetical protein
MADYQEAGYNVFIENPVFVTQGELSDLDAEALLGNISANKILGTGSISSQDGRLALNLGDNLFKVNDGTRDRVKFGLFEDGEYGLRIYDRDGNTLVDITGSNNLIQSSDGSMQLDMSDKQFRVYEGNVLRVLLGYQQGGF